MAINLKACVAVTPAELLALFVGNRPESETLVNEFVDLGLADHPDFVRLMETAVGETANIAAHAKAKLMANRLLDNARIAAQRLNGRVIAGHRCGVLSCDREEANVYAELEGNISYVRLDRVNKVVIKPHYTNPAYEFVKSHFDAFEQLCSSLDHATQSEFTVASELSMQPPKKMQTPKSPGMSS